MADDFLGRGVSTVLGKLLLDGAFQVAGTDELMLGGVFGERDITEDILIVIPDRPQRLTISTEPATVVDTF